jgi:hypothetical protein
VAGYLYGDAFVARLSADGSALVHSKTRFEEPQAIATFLILAEERIRVQTASGSAER